MHDLEERLAEWRKEMIALLPNRPEAVMELECHLREQIALLVEQGVVPEVAWRDAEQRLGTPRLLAREFTRMEAPWWIGSNVRLARGLAYVAGALSIATLCFYLVAALWGVSRLMSGREVSSDVRWSGFWQVFALLFMLMSLLVIRASSRFLEQPSVPDLRGIIGFILLVLWMAMAISVDLLHIAYSTKVLLVGISFLAVGVAWRIASRTVTAIRT